MTNKWIFSLVSWTALVGTALMSAAPAMAQCSSYTTNGYTSSPAYSAYITTPTYANAAYPAPVYSGYGSVPYAGTPGCPLYSNGQWRWNGSSWMWCPPATAYAPAGSAFVGYYATPTASLTGSPLFDLALGVTAASLMYPNAYQAPYPYAAPAYVPPITTGAAFYPSMTTAGTVVNITRVHRVVRVVRRDFDDRHRAITGPIARDRLADQRARIEANRDRLAAQRSRIETNRDRLTAQAPRRMAPARSFVPPRTFAAPRAAAAPRFGAMPSRGGRQRPPR